MELSCELLGANARMLSGLYQTRKEDKGVEDGADSLGISKWDKEEKGKQTLETHVNPNQRLRCGLKEKVHLEAG